MALTPRPWSDDETRAAIAWLVTHVDIYRVAKSKAYKAIGELPEVRRTADAVKSRLERLKSQFDLWMQKKQKGENTTYLRDLGKFENDLTFLWGGGEGVGPGEGFAGYDPTLDPLSLAYDPTGTKRRRLTLLPSSSSSHRTPTHPSHFDALFDPTLQLEEIYLPPDTPATDIQARAMLIKARADMASVQVQKMAIQAEQEEKQKDREERRGERERRRQWKAEMRRLKWEERERERQFEVRVLEMRARLAELGGAGAGTGTGVGGGVGDEVGEVDGNDIEKQKEAMMRRRHVEAMQREKEAMLRERQAQQQQEQQQHQQHQQQELGSDVVL
ncbi:hypothetical protein HDV00_004365 [Rhizophlyctis rosea]|nr:hypothetical protein HDV00_004365 [Rhizophlyctis rosea]